MKRRMAPPPSFTIFESFFNGVRLCLAHARLFGVLSFLPFVVTLLTLVALRVAGPSLGMFWLPVIQLPSSFVIGIEGALILRFVLMQEYPILEDSLSKVQRNRAVLQAATVYAAITYFVTGFYAVLLQIRDFADKNPAAAEPWMPMLLALMVLILWSARWFWLHVPLALNWPVDAFFARIGRWSGSLRIFLLFALCSILFNVLAGFLRMVILAVSGKHPGGFAAAFDDGVVAFATVALAVLFTACTAAAVRMMMRTRGVTV